MIHRRSLALLAMILASIGALTMSGPVAGAASTLPGAPSGVKAIAGNAFAKVTWVAPSDGGSVIFSYTVTSSPGVADCPPMAGMACPMIMAPVKTCISTSPSCLVNGLTNGFIYVFYVTATNKNGTGPRSASSNSVIPSTVPDAPLNVKAIAGKLLAKITWSASSNGGSPVTGYTVSGVYSLVNCIPTPGKACIAPLYRVIEVCTATSLSCTAKGLTAGIVYWFFVKATNKNGSSPASEVSTPVIPTA